MAISIVLLTSCSGGHPPIHLPEGFSDTASPVVKDPYAPNSICLFTRHDTGSIIGEWIEVGRVDAIISEVDCITLDTTGFSTRWEKRWVFRNDSVVHTYWQDVPFKNDSVDYVFGGAEGQSWTYEMRGVNDTILMVDNDQHNFHDTLRITRLNGDTMILASVKYQWGFQPPVRKSVVYIRRK